MAAQVEPTWYCNVNIKYVCGGQTGGGYCLQMKRYQNTLRLAIVVRCVAIAPTARNRHAKAPRSSVAAVCVATCQCCQRSLLLPVLGWAEERAASAFHGCHGTVES